MSKGRCLGLVGGLGVGATVHYYEKLAKAHEANGRTLDIVIAHAETSRVFEYVQAGDAGGLAEYLAGFIRRLKTAGAEVAAIPAVTPHYCIRLSPLPVFNIFEPLAQELETRGARRVAVFGTRFVMESGLFGFIENAEIVQPKPEEMSYIHDTYAELARLGKGSEEKYQSLSALAHTLRKREELDAIVLAGTDLALIFNEANTDFPCIDCAALHLKAILDGLLNPAPAGGMIADAYSGKRRETT
jgi:aspartate racemase